MTYEKKRKKYGYLEVLGKVLRFPNSLLEVLLGINYTPQLKQNLNFKVGVLGELYAS